jgi:zinc transporter
MTATPTHYQHNQGLASQGVLFAKLFMTAGEHQVLSECPQSLPEEGSSFLWAHVDLVDRRSGIWLTQLGLSADLCKFLMSDDVRQMADYEGQIIFGTIAEPSEETQHYKSRHGLLRFIVSKSWIITGRFHPLNAVEALKASVERGELVSGPFAIMEKLITHFYRQLQDEAGKVLSAIDYIEDLVIESGGTHSSTKVASIRRTTANILRQIAQYRHVQHDLSNILPRLNYSEKHIETAQDYVERFDALRVDFQSLQDRARLVKDEIASNLAMEMNQSLYLLSLMSALLLPPSVIFGLFGINVGGLPWLNHPLGFTIVVLIGLLSATCVFLILRRRA